MKKECSKCFYYTHITKDPFCFKHFNYKPKPCEDFRMRSCQDCKYGKDFDKCQLKEKAFPKQNYCKDFARYEGWSYNEQ